MRDRSRVVLIALAVLAADWATKALVVARMPLYDRLVVVDGLLNITHVQNRGAAFGLFAGIASPFLQYLLIAVSVAAVVLIWFYAREGWHHPATVAAFGAILGGALGNLVDRIRFGYVVDFVDVHVGAYHWPSFNVADAAITVGAVALFVTMARHGEAESEEPTEETAETATAPSPGASDDRRAEDLL